MIKPTSPLKDALSAISKSGAMMSCIVNHEEKLLGIITDSDIRKALLRGASIDDPVDAWMNSSPLTLPVESATEDIVALSNSEGIREIPLLSKTGVLLDVFVAVFHESRQADSSEDLTKDVLTSPLPNAMFIFAGGKGTRLRSVVNDRPKPLAMVGNKPILQTIIQRASNHGIKKFFIAVNYLAHQIEEHLKSPIYSALDITIIKEQEFLGTAGALGLMETQISDDLIVCNGDVLTKIPFETLLKRHKKEGADLSCVVRPHKTTIPYGVFSVNDGKIENVIEKPTYTHLVNSGIYVISQAVLKLIKKNEKIDMTDLIKKLIDSHKKVSPFVLYEYWLDIGQPDDYHKAIQDYKEHFGELL